MNIHLQLQAAITMQVELGLVISMMEATTVVVDKVFGCLEICAVKVRICGNDFGRLVHIPAVDVLDDLVYDV